MDNTPSSSDNMPSIKGIRGFIIPLRPTMDKLIALWLALRAIGRKLSEVEVISYSSSDPRDQFLREKEAQGFYLVDVGRNKYQSRETGSAVETVTRDFGISDPILLSLVAIANHNNATGYLKSYHPNVSLKEGEVWEYPLESGSIHGVHRVYTSGFNWSAVWLLRDSYKVGWDVDEVIVHVHRLLDVWLAIQQGYVESHWRRRLAQHGRIRKLWELFGSPALERLPLFSIPQLVFQLAVLEDEEGELENSTRRIESEIRWWFSVQRAIIDERIKARRWALRLLDHLVPIEELGEVNSPFRKGTEQWFKNLFEGLVKADFSIPQGTVFWLKNLRAMKCVFVTATEMQVRELFHQKDDDESTTNLLNVIFSGRAASQKFGCVINRDPHSGEYAVLTGAWPLDFSAVHARLKGLERQLREEEPEEETLVWHLDVKGKEPKVCHQLLNGSPGWPLPPSMVSPAAVISCVWESTWLMGYRPQRNN